MESITILVDPYYPTGYFLSKLPLNDCPFCDTYHIDIGVPTIQGRVVISTVIDFLEDPRQTENVRAKPTAVVVARVMHEHWCIAFVSVNPPGRNTGKIEKFSVQTPVCSLCT